MDAFERQLDACMHYGFDKYVYSGILWGVNAPLQVTFVTMCNIINITIQFLD